MKRMMQQQYPKIKFLSDFQKPWASVLFHFQTAIVKQEKESF